MANPPGRQSFASVATALAALRAGILIARPITESVAEWQEWGTRTGLTIARTFTAPLVPESAPILDAISVAGIRAVRGLVGASLELSHATLAAADRTLPETDRLAAQLSLPGMLEKVLELFAADRLEIVNGNGIAGQIRTMRKLRAWAAVLDETRVERFKRAEDALISLNLCSGDLSTNQSMTAEPIVTDPQLTRTELPSIIGSSPLVEGTTDHEIVIGNLDSLPADSAGLASQDRALPDLLRSTDPKDIPLLLQHFYRLSRLCTGSYGEHFVRFLNGQLPPYASPSGDDISSHTSHTFLASHAKLQDPSHVLHSTHTLPLGTAGTALGTYHPLLFILRDSTNRSITIVIRGTGSLADVLCDVAASSIPYDSGMIHSQFLAAGKLLVQPDSPFMRALRAELEAHPGYSVVLAGHSLGAAIASVLALLLEGMLDVPVHAVALASPALASVEIGTSERVRKIVTNVILDDDPVPCLSFAAIKDLKRILNAMEELGCAEAILDHAAALERIRENLACLDQPEPSRPLPGAFHDTESENPPDRATISADLEAQQSFFWSTHEKIMEVFGARDSGHLYPAGRILWIRDGELYEVRDAERVLNFIEAIFAEPPSRSIRGGFAPTDGREVMFARKIVESFFDQPSLRLAVGAADSFPPSIVV